MRKVFIIGKGNVGTHLCKALGSSSAEVQIIDSRTLEGLSPSATDIILICVADSAIEGVAANLKENLPEDFNGIVAHTAGSVGMTVLSKLFKHYGVFYPLQTFSKDLPISDYSAIPIFIEGESDETVKGLEEPARRIGAKTFHYNSEQRKILHLSSVFACNFANCMYGIAEEMLNKHNIRFEVLHPLIMQTAEKALAGSPRECQTGPARRGDAGIIKNQTELIKQELPGASEIYKTISDYILKQYVTISK